MTPYPLEGWTYVEPEEEFEDGEEVETVPESEHVRLDVGPRADGPHVR